MFSCLTFCYECFQAKDGDNPPSSPYPDRVSSAAAAAQAKSAHASEASVCDARATLKETQERRAYLESNLDAILRAQQETEVYAAIDALTHG